MSRIRTGITPDAWLDIGPATPYSSNRPKLAAVAVTGIAEMRPILSVGNNFQTGPAIGPRTDWRRTQAADDSRRYRARKAQA